MKLVGFISLFILFSQTAIAAGTLSDWSYAEKRLRKEGFTSSFIKVLKETYEPNGFNQVVELNLLLFLKKADYHGVQVNSTAVSDVRTFMENHRSYLQRAEKDYGVPGSAVASLLWLESRYGVNQGTFHVPSVYVHLLQSERKPVVQHLHGKAGDFTDKVTPGAIKEITKRTTKKAKWAVDELRALQKIYKRDKKLVKELRGSFAGAFGIPQFIPSSYVSWARPYKRNSVANLSRAEDAICSVAYYLKGHGWKKAKPKSHLKSLMKYNNSEDYANAILKLAQQVNMSPKGRLLYPQTRRPSEI